MILLWVGVGAYAVVMLIVWALCLAAATDDEHTGPRP